MSLLRGGESVEQLVADMEDDAIIDSVYRHMAAKELGVGKAEVKDMSDEAVRLALLRHWATELTYTSEGKIGSMAEADLKQAPQHRRHQ